LKKNNPVFTREIGLAKKITLFLHVKSAFEKK